MSAVTRGERKPEVHLVTDAARGRAQDIDARKRSYLIKMGIRTVCLIVAIVLYAVGVPWPFLLVLIVASTVLPWMSVVVANAGPLQDPRRRQPSWYPDEPPNALRPGRTPPEK